MIKTEKVHAGTLEESPLVLDFDYKIENQELFDERDKWGYINCYKISFDSKYTDSFLEQFRNNNGEVEYGQYVYKKRSRNYFKNVYLSEKYNEYYYNEFKDCDFVKNSNLLIENNNINYETAHVRKTQRFRQIRITSEYVFISVDTSSKDKTIAYVILTNW